MVWTVVWCGVAVGEVWALLFYGGEWCENGVAWGGGGSGGMVQYHTIHTYTKEKLIGCRGCRFRSIELER